VRVFFISLRKKRLAAALSRAVLHEDVQDVVVLVDGPPQVLLVPIDFDEDLVQVPFVTRPGLPAAQRACVPLPELGAPAAHRLVGDGAPRSSMSSSTSRKDRGKRKYSHTQWEMTSTGYRCPLYDGDTAPTDSPLQHDQPEDHPTGQPT
jgi:hypothetical protein